MTINKTYEFPSLNADSPYLRERLLFQLTEWVFRIGKALKLSSGHPDFDKLKDDVVIWLYEYTPKKTFGPIRELGLNSEGVLIVATPDDRNDCISTDSIEDIKLNPDLYLSVEVIPKSEFEDLWSRRAKH